jgi:hypothetical protein
MARWRPLQGTPKKPFKNAPIIADFRRRCNEKIGETAGEQLAAGTAKEHLNREEGHQQERLTRHSFAP